LCPGDNRKADRILSVGEIYQGWELMMMYSTT
jgi:hypothetical protein